LKTSIARFSAVAKSNFFIPEKELPIVRTAPLEKQEQIREALEIPALQELKRLGAIARGCMEIARFSIDQFTRMLSNEARNINVKRLKDITVQDVEAIFAGRRLLSRSEWKLVLGVCGENAMRALSTESLPELPEGTRNWIQSIFELRQIKAQNERRRTLVQVSLEILRLCDRDMDTIGRAVAHYNMLGVETTEKARAVLSEIAAGNADATDFQWFAIGRALLAFTMRTIGDVLANIRRIESVRDYTDEARHRGKVLSALLLITGQDKSIITRNLKRWAPQIGAAEYVDAPEKIDDVLAGEMAVEDAIWALIVGTHLRNGIETLKLLTNNSERLGEILRGCAMLTDRSGHDLVMAIRRLAERRFLGALASDTEKVLESIFADQITPDADDWFVVAAMIVKPALTVLEQEQSFLSMK
jgi:hypothetical protein